MKPFRFFLMLLPLLSIGASAQSAREPQAAASQSTSEQRRAELRAALKARGAPEPQPKEAGPAGVPPNRRLSEQERADLRQQLLQQKPGAKPERP